MKEKLKALGLALVAAMAMTAITASAATAEGYYVAGSYPATLVGVGEGSYQETIGEHTLTCKSTEYHAELTEQSPEIEITPSFEECTLAGFVAKTRLNGCVLIARVPEKISKDLYRGGLDLVCPPGNAWEVETPACVVTYHTQEWVENFILEDDTEGPKKRFTEIHNGKNKRAGIDPKFFCPFGGGEIEGIEFHATINWGAEDGEGEPVDVYVE